MPLGIRRVTATQRCHVPSGWMGPSHLLRTGPPYWHPAPAGGAVATGPAAISRAANPPTTPRFMVASRRPDQQTMTLPRMRSVCVGVSATKHSWVDSAADELAALAGARVGELDALRQQSQRCAEIVGGNINHVGVQRVTLDR